MDVPYYLSKYDPDPLRFYLSAIAPETRDTEFSWEDFVERNNNELVATWGNLANRMLSFAYKRFDGQVPEPGDPSSPSGQGLDDEDRALLERVEEGFETVGELYNACKFRAALGEAMALAREANGYLDRKAPWLQIKEDRQVAATSVYVILRVVDNLKTSLGPEHADVASIYHNLGGLEHARGRYARGEPFARRSVTIRKKALGPDHPDVAADRAALAALLDGQDKYAEAEQLYRQALAIFERAYGPEHYELAVNYNNLAAIYQAQGRDAEAEQLYRRAVAIKEKVLGPDHPDLAMTLNNLAVLHKSLGRYADAEPLYRRSPSIFEQALGATHPHVITCRANYAQLLREMGRVTDAAQVEASA